MTQEIDCKILIKEVEKRTSLYDTSKKEYHDRNLKKKLWNEVCQEVYSSSVWDLLSNEEKTKYGKEVQKRWSSLRHGFRKELSAQKMMPSGSAAKKKRKYLYFDSLLFLLPFTEVTDTEGSIENENNETDQRNLKNITSPAQPRFSKPRTVQKNSDDEVISLLREGNQMLSTSKTCDKKHDEDELFLRSLTSYMKDFSGDQKLLLRIEIIKLILNFKQSLNNNSRFCKINRTPNVINETPRREPMSSIENRINDPLQSMYTINDSSENLEYIPQPSTSQRFNNVLYTPTPVHREYVSIRSPENDSPVHQEYVSIISTENDTPVHREYVSIPSPENDTRDTLLSIVDY